MSQLSFEQIEKVEELREVTFLYSITMPRKYHSSCESFIFDVNGLSKDEIAEKCEADMRKKMNNLFDGDDCDWKVTITKQRKV